MSYSLREVYESDRPILHDLRQQKAMGERLCIEDLTYSTLLSLWTDELASDQEIAEVYNTDANTIYAMRHQLGITNKACIDKYMSRASEILGSLGYSIMQLKMA